MVTNYICVAKCSMVTNNICVAKCSMVTNYICVAKCSVVMCFDQPGCHAERFFAILKVEVTKSAHIIKVWSFLQCF